MWKRKKPAAPTREPLVLEELEPRILFSAGMEGVLLDTDDMDVMNELLDEVPAVEFVLPALENTTPVVAAETQPLELVVVDSATPDYQRLVDDILAQVGEERRIEVVMLDDWDDGIAQLGEILADRSDLDAVHLISHATDGAVSLGGSTLNFDTLLNRSSSIKNWSNAFTEDGDFLIYGCNLAASADGQALVDALGRLTGADVAASDDLTGHESLGGDWELEYQQGVIDTEVAVSEPFQDAWMARLDTAVWRENGSGTPETSEWDVTTFGPEGAAANVGSWRIMQGAESPTRDEKIVLGVETGNRITGMIWDGSNWSQISLDGSTVFGTVTQNYWWGFDVQYESQSGHALMTWTDGSTIEYAVWNGSAWSSVGTIGAYSGATPRQLQLAASPNSDEMVLVVSDSNSHDFSFVWDGSSWGNAVTLSATSGDDRTDIYVTYEQQSGDAMVVYGKANIDAYYRTWDGTNWSSEDSVAQAIGTSGNVRWTTMASDPNSDRIAIGVLTSDSDVWFNVWDGSNWATSTAATTTSTGTTELAMAVAFESTSGDLIATYGESGSSNIKYMTWSAGGGWSAEQTGPNIGGVPNSMTLSSDPISDSIMLAVNDDNSDVNCVLWNGSTWSTPTEHEVDSGETKNQPFLFLWDQDSDPNQAPVAVTDSVTTNEDTPVLIDVLANDTDPENDTLTVLGFERVVALYHAGTSGTAPDPATVAGGSWIFEDTEDGNAATGNLQASSVSPDGVTGQNGWNVTDNTDTAEYIWYRSELSAADATLADSNGWSLSAEIRMADDFSDTRTAFMRYGNGTTRFLAYFDLDTNGDLQVELVDDLGPQIITLTSDGAGADDYHKFEIVYDPLTATAAFLADGVRVENGNWGGQASANTGVRWGMGSASGQGSANYHSIEMKVFDQSITTAGGATVWNNGDGTVNYSPASNISGADTFSYTIRDSEGHLASAAVNVTVDAVNDTPTDLIVGTSTDGGLGLNVDGGNDAYLLAADGNAIFGGLTATTMEIQFSSTTLPVDGGDADFVTYGAATQSSNNIWFGTWRNDAGAGHQLGLGVDGAYVYATGYDANALFDGELHTVSVTWEAGNYEFFVDGASVGSGTGFKSDHTMPGGGDLVIGMEQDAIGGGFESHQVLQATVYDVRIFDDARTPAEVLAGVGQTVAPTEGGLVANWVFNDLSTSGVVTDTVSGNDLTVMHASGAGFVGSVPSLTLTVSEDAPLLAIVGSVSTIDPDSGDTFTYALLDDAGGRFSIDGTTGEVKVANPTLLNFEAVSSHNITIQVTDSGGLTYSEVFSISIIDANDAPVITSNGAGVTASINVAENTTAVTTVTASDADVDSLSYTISGGADAVLFNIDSNSGVLTFIAAPNFEAPTDANADNVYEVTVQASDGTASDTQAISVTVTEVLELVVSNTNATGTGSLHEAILNANANTGVTDTITFNIGGGGAQTILVDPAGLPIITDSIILDATTQPGYSGTPLITLDGSSIPASSGINGITIRANDSTVKGFIVINFPDEGIEIDGSTGFGDNNTVQGNWVGIDKNGNVAGVTEHGIMVSVDATGNQIGGAGPNEGNVVAGNGLSGIVIRQNSDNNIVEGNIIGLKADGTTVAGNVGHGVLISLSSDGNRIGGSAPGARNIISGNSGDGIHIDGTTDATYTTAVTGTVVKGNYIGTDTTGNTQAGNDIQDTGITINDSSGNIVGGTAAGDANVLSGNRLRGLIIVGSTSTDNVVSGNFIGTNADGSAALTNIGGGQQIGVYLYDTPGNTIGGTTASAGNVISGNITYGIYAWGPNSTGNKIQGNTIGLDAAQSIAIGNGGAGGGGIMLSNAPDNIVGGTASGAINVISGHLGTGVAISGVGATGNTLLGNEIYDNGTLGIDLGNNGVSGNDPDDADTGANNLQNFPVITQADLIGTNLAVSGTLDTDGLNTEYRIEFFGNTVGTEDATNGEAGVYLGTVTVTTDGSGDATFSNVTFSGVTLGAGDYVTATATKIEDAGKVGVDELLAYGATSEFAANVAIVHVNVAPVLTNGSAVTYSEGNGTSPFLATGTLIDADSADFDGGSLTFSIASGGDATDTLRLGILNGVTVSDNDVYVSGVLVGTKSGGTGGTPYTISFNSNATQARVETLFQNLIIVSTGDNPTTGVRNLEVVITDGDGGTSNIATATADMTTAANDDPSNAGTLPTDVTVTEDVATNIDLSGIDFADPDANGGELTVTLSTSTGGQLSLSAGTGITHGGTPSATTVTGTLADLNAYFDNTSNISYLHSTANLNGDNADTLTISIVDNGNTGSGGGGSINLGSINVDISAVDDSPVLNDLTTSVAEDAVNTTALTNLNEANTGNDTDLDGTALIYSITGGNSDGIFVIDSATGEITVSNNTNLDYETTQQYVLTIEVSDGVNSDTAAVTVDVTNVNDNAPLINDLTTSVAEDAANTTAVTNLNEANTGNDTDLDGTALTYSITGGNGDGIFAIDSATGEITVANNTNLDYETTQQYILTIEATDGTNTDTAAVTIDVTDVNESAVGPVTDNDGTGNTVAEDALVGDSVGITGLASDADGTDTVTYSLSDDAGGLFTIDANTGVIAVANALDYETATSHSVTVLATSSDTSTSNQAFTINVTDVNESAVGPVRDNDGTGNTVAEDALVGDSVGITGLATDADGTDTVTYSLSNDAGGLFTIDANTGVIAVANALDYETATSHSVTVVATSSDTSTSNQAFTINVTDVNESAVGSVTDNDGTGNTVAEDALVGDSVGITGLATDADGTDTVTYTLSDDAGGLFSIDANTGVITVANALDYETATSHSVTVLATSSDTSTSSQAFTINVTDVNESAVGPVTDNDGTGNSVAEDALVGDSVGITGLATDADGTDTVTYSLSDDAGGLFTIDSNTGVITVANALDYETATSHSVTVLATSSDASTSNQAFTINVTDVNESAVGPVTDSDGTGNTVAEDALVGDAVGITGLATDPDGTDTVTYSLSDDAGGLFTIDSNTGVITVANALDYETATSHSVTVVATSSDTSTSNQAFTINVTDVNESAVGPVTDNDGTGNSVAEDATVGTSVGITGLATDPDGTDTVTYTLSDDAGGLFSIDANTGVITVANALDYETATSHSVTVLATSSDTSTSSQAFTINVTDVNESAVGPVTDNDGTGNSVAEDALVGDAVGITGLATDPDGTDTVTYSLSDDAGGLFTIDSNTGVITVANALDYETATSHSVTVLATSSDTSTSNQAFTINVTDVNESAVGPVTDNDGTGNTVAEDALVGDSVGITGLATDADGTDTVTYSLSDDAGGLFTIDTNTGVITVANALDYETATSHSVTVVATSSDTSTSSQAFTINVSNVNDVAPIVTSNGGGATANLNLPEEDSAVTDVDATDIEGDTLTFGIAGGTDAGRFSINAGNGVLNFLTAPDYENPGDSNGDNIYEVMVQVTDGIHTDTQTLNIIVTDVNESSPGVIPIVPGAGTDKGKGDPNPGGPQGYPDAPPEQEPQDPGEVIPGGAEEEPRGSGRVTTENSQAAESEKGEGIDLLVDQPELEYPKIIEEITKLNNGIKEESKVSQEILEQVKRVQEAVLKSNGSGSHFNGAFDNHSRVVRAESDWSFKSNEKLRSALDQVHREMDGADRYGSKVEKYAVKMAVGTTASISAGYVIWTLRGGALVSSFLSTVPLWKGFDPLPVLAATKKGEKVDNEDQENESDADKIFSTVEKTDRQVKP